MTQQHTPGPWKWKWYSSPGEAQRLVSLDGEDILSAVDGQVYDDYDSDSAHIDVSEANARLIAAAPDTAAELERVKALNAEMVQALTAISELADAQQKAGDNYCAISFVGDYLRKIRAILAKVSNA